MCNSWGDFLQWRVVNIRCCEWRLFNFCLLRIKDSPDEMADVDVWEPPCLIMKWIILCSFAGMAPGFHRAGRWLWAVSLLFVTAFPELALGLRIAICILPLPHTSGDLWCLCRDSSLWQLQQHSWGKLQKSFRSQKYLWKWESLGRCCKLRVICFLPSCSRRVLMRESSRTGGI